MRNQRSLVIAVFMGNLSLSQALSLNKHHHHRKDDAPVQHSWQPAHWTFMNESEYRNDTPKAYDKNHKEPYTKAMNRAEVDALVAKDAEKIYNNATVAAKKAEHVTDVHQTGIGLSLVQDSGVDNVNYGEEPVQYMSQNHRLSGHQRR
jgi:hypothetical protein